MPDVSSGYKILRSERRDGYQRTGFEVKKTQRITRLGKGPCIYGKKIMVNLKTLSYKKKSLR